MRFRKGTAILGVGIASAAALAASSAAASAASAPTYSGAATATAGSLNFGTGPAGPPNTSTASDARPSAGTATGIYHGDLPNGLGTIFTTNDADAVTTRAQVFPDGTSTACSAVASGACGPSSTPLNIRLNLQHIFTVADSIAGNNEVPITNINDALGPLGGYSLVIGITGPAATCTAGRSAGSPPGAFTITRNIVSGTVDLQDGTKSVIGGAKTIGTNGDVLVPLFVNAVNPALAKIPNADVKLKYTPGADSGVGLGPTTSAQIGTLVVSVNGFTVATLTGGKVTCGPNTLTSSPVPASAASSAAPNRAAAAGKPASRPAPGITPAGGLPLAGGLGFLPSR